MGGISQWSSELRGLPDQALQQELQQPTGLIPSYLVLAEAQRRQTMRQQAQQQQAKGDSSTVLQDVVRNMMSGQPPPGIAPAGMTPPPTGQTPGMARGGRYDEGGEVDEEDDERNAPIPSAIQSRLIPQTRAEGQELVNRAVPAKYRPSHADIDNWINVYSEKYGVDPDMARSIMWQESRGNPNAVSSKGAMGLFQLLPGTASDMGVDPRVPEQNVEGGIKYFGKQMQDFGNPQAALAAYNAGPGAVRHHFGVPPFPETTKYIAAITDHYNQLKAQQQQAAPQAAADAAAANTPTPQAAANAPPAQQPAPPAQTGPQTVDQPTTDTGTNFDVAAYAPPPVGRIHQTINELGTRAASLQKQLDDLKDPYDPANMQTQRQNILQFYGLPPNYLQNYDAMVDQRKAQIRQFQEEAAMRYHQPNPWEFLSNIAAGMGQSRSLNLAGAFGQGVGLAWQRRDEEQQRAFQDWNALQQDSDALDRSADQARGRFDTVLQQILTHQGTVNEAQRKMLEDQLSKNTGEQDKFKKMLVPTNKLEPLYNPGDYDKADWDRAVQEAARVHGWNKDRMQKEIQAVQLLAQRGDAFQQNNGQFASAYDQFIQKYPQEANKLLTPGKYSDADIASFANSANIEPAALYDPKVVPKEAMPQVRAYMTQQGMRIPVQPPNKALHDSAALAGRTITHLNRLNNWAQDPWMVENVFGPWMGRMAKGEEQVGMDAFPGLKNATPQQTRDTQDLLTSLNYLRMIEGKGLLGGRPAQQLMQQLLQTSPDVHMTVPRFLGAMDATRASANMAIQADRDFMYGTQSTGAIPAGAQVAQDKNGRRIMRTAPGQKWFYMDTNEPVK